MSKQSPPSHTDDKLQEQVEISFLGFKFKCTNPTFKTTIILVIILIFLFGLVALLRT